MSGPKTASYAVDSDAIQRQERERESEQAQNRRQESESVQEKSRKRKEEERLRKEEERRQRQAQQHHSLALGELKWRARDVHKRLFELQNKILRWQAVSPGRLELNMQLTSPPSGDNQEQQLRYIADNTALIQSVEQQMAQKRPSLDAEQATRALVAAMGQSSSTARRTAQETLASCAPSSQQVKAPPKIVKDPLAELRNHITEVVRHFLQQEKTPLSAELERLLAALFEATDERLASGLAFEVEAKLGDMKQQLVEEKAEAQRLLDGLPQSKHAAVAEIRRRLGEVCLGNERMAQELRDSVLETVQLVKSEERVIRVAVSGIVHDALEDLGYEVEPVESTLFVKGGVVHFRKSGWDDGYFVRMRVDGDTEKMNFNMVRVTQNADVQDDLSKDITMENAWCADFQRVNDTFKSRGVSTKVERHLAAGELPVQKVVNKSLNSEHWQKRAEQKNQSTQPAAQQKHLYRK